jgi:hypothetical protein
VLRRARSVVPALIGLCFTIGAARAQTVDPNAWETDGYVTAIATIGNTVYLGGSFGTIGLNTGHFAAFDAGSGTPEAGWPRIEGPAKCSAADGEGGLYVGGSFTLPDGTPFCVGHIRADKTLDAWPAGEHTTVYTLAVSGSTVYVGGTFTNIGGQARKYIAALDATTGLATAWNPNANYLVTTLAVKGSTVYVGGSFQNVGGQNLSCIAALDATTGLATPWNPWANGDLEALAVAESVVYVCGTFSSIGGQPRSRLAAIDASSGFATA